MAIVKIMFRKSADRVLNYVFEHAQVGDRVDSENCPPYAKGASEEFEVVRDQHHFQEGNNQVAHVIQSWDSQDSQTLTPKEVNAMGRQLVEEHFKGHQFVVVTHTDTGKFHNHIVVSTLNMETGKQMDNKFHHLHDLRARNDKLCLERGLKIPNKEATLRRANVPQKVQQMVRAGRESWVWDLKNKADVARNLATSYDQYVEYLDGFGIKARIEDKNISYSYPGRSRAKRGSKLGKGYDKAGLESQFKANDERFSSKPEMRQNLWAGYHYLTQTPSTYLKNPDYSAYTKVSRREPQTVTTSSDQLRRGIIPAAELKKARRSILEYCNENKIPLSQNATGQTVLTGKDYIVIQGHEAINTKNGTRATLIDFVASHHKLTLLQAVAKINNNHGLSEFEQHFGDIKRKYTSFYIPSPDQMKYPSALEHLSSFLKSNGMNSKMADPLLKHQRVEISKEGAVRLFAAFDPSGTIEFSQNPDQTWSQKSQGVFKKPFFKRAPKGKQMLLFTEPKSYLSGRGTDLLSDRKTHDGILVLMEPNSNHVEHYLSENPEIKKVQFVTPKGNELSKTALDFFGVLKKKLEPKGIELSTVSHEKALSHGMDGPSL